MSKGLNNVSFMRNGKEFEPTKNELKIVLDDYVKRVFDLEAKLSLTEKALELACSRIFSDAFPSASQTDKESRHDILINDFKTKAKEIMKDA